jgi:hypothetical protein
VSAALGFVAACAALWQLLHRATAMTVGASVLAVTWLALSKFSAVLFAPMAVLLVGIRWWWGDASGPVAGVGLRRGAGIAVLHVAVVWFAIWASYGFRYQAFAGDAPAQFSEDWSTVQVVPGGGPAPAAGLINAARRWNVLPEAYLYGFSHTLKFSQVRRSFMNGEITRTGRLGFFPYAFAVKSPLPLILLVALGLGALVVLRPPGSLYDAAPLFVLVAVYGGAALTSDLNIGHRHLLPLYPALMILAGYGTLWMKTTGTEPDSGKRPRPSRKRVTAPALAASQWRPAAVVGIIVLGAWYASESMRIRPDYLAYFNQLAGGPGRGYTHLVDSSLDWGQDLPALKAWLEANQGPGEPLYLSYFGTSSPEHFGISADVLPGLIDRRHTITGAPLRAGVYAISATMLQGVYGVVEGPWTAQEETQYRQTGDLMRELMANPLRREQVARAEGRDVLPEVVDSFEKLRFARLTAWLRRQPPLAQAGYSIQIYRLSDADLVQALSAPINY